MTAKILFYTFAIAALASSLSSCKRTEAAAMLVINFDQQPKSAVEVLYEEDGESFYETLQPDSLGSYVYSPKLKGNNSDVMIFVGQRAYGSHVAKGKKAQLTIGDATTFGGDNVERAKFFNAYCQAYNPYDFKPKHTDTIYDAQAYLDKLKAGHERAHALTAAISDRQARDAAIRMNDASRDYYTIQIYKYDGMFNDNKHRAEIDSIISGVDPNSEEARISGMLNYWYDNSPLHKQTGYDLTDYLTRQILGVDSLLTNKANVRSLTTTLGQMFFAYDPKAEDIEKFMSGIEPVLSAAPGIKAQFQEYINQINSRIADGSPLPSDPTLIAPDGSKCKMSSLLGDKLVYVDIWATWCVPCCREIPYMEKLVEKYKGNDNVTFLSISCDDDLDAWHKKLAKDKPQWPQYVFDKRSGDEFMEAMSINGIPRFLLIGPDALFVAVDAARPSDEKIHEIIDSNL